MLVYSSSITARLQYICGFLGQELTGKAFDLTDNPGSFSSFSGPKINYSHARIADEPLWLLPHSLLFEKGITEQNVEIFGSEGVKTFFRTAGEHPFDIFAACFYLLSRYEEYLPHKKDEYDRYAHINSIAFKNGFLDIPLVDHWLNGFRKILRDTFPGITLKEPLFCFLPTYDIDEAWSYLHKDLSRTTGAVIKAIVKGNFSMIRERRAVMSGRLKDPFDSYDWMDTLHQQFKLNPRYFFLVAARTGKYDKNILPGRSAIKSLIGGYAGKYTIGLHPSWQSGDDPALIKKEKETLAHLAGQEIISSRQHFIRFNLPETYRHLIDAGIREDFSMGYGSINGFRASVSLPFYWYDLEREEQTPLLVHPFCYMEANSFFEQHFDPDQALDEMRKYYREIRSVNGTMITIWHNTFLGTGKLFKGWREIYLQFLKELKT